MGFIDSLSMLIVYIFDFRHNFNDLKVFNDHMT